ncbi:MAG TPA: hypothetical protein VGL57_03895 [Solirubrobacteraceae bacterium]
MDEKVLVTVAACATAQTLNARVAQLSATSLRANGIREGLVRVDIVLLVVAAQDSLVWPEEDPSAASIADVSDARVVTEGALNSLRSPMGAIVSLVKRSEPSAGWAIEWMNLAPDAAAGPPELGPRAASSATG